jgi:hypothetical protein
MKLFGQVFDERLRDHRRRSTAVAGIVSCVLSIVLFEYFLIFEGNWRWDLLSVGLAFAAVKLGMRFYYYLKH